MKPVDFKEANTTFAKTQPEYIDLPAHRDSEGIITSCWEMTWRERLTVLFTGKVFLQVMTFNKPLQPQKLAGSNPVI